MGWGDIVGSAGESLGGLSSAISAGTIVAQEKARQAQLDEQKAIDDAARRRFEDARTAKINYEMGEPARKNELLTNLGKQMNLSPKRQAVLLAGGPEALSSFDSKINQVYAHHADAASKGQFLSPMQYRSEMIAAGEDDLTKLDRDVQTFQETQRVYKTTKTEEEAAKRKFDTESDIEKERRHLINAQALQTSADRLRDENEAARAEREAKAKKAQARDKMSNELDMTLRRSNAVTVYAEEAQRAIEDYLGLPKGQVPPEPKFWGLFEKAGKVIDFSKLKAGLPVDEKLGRVFQALSNLRGQAGTLAPKGNRTALNIEEIKQHFAKPDSTMYEAYLLSRGAEYLSKKFDTALRADVRDAAAALDVPAPAAAVEDPSDLNRTNTPTGTAVKGPPLPLDLRQKAAGAPPGKQYKAPNGWIYDRAGNPVRYAGP